MFEKMKAALGLSNIPPLLVDVLKVLKADTPTRYDRVVGYIVAGETPEVVGEVQQAASAVRTLLGKPGSWPYWDKDLTARVARTVIGWTKDKQEQAWNPLMTTPEALTPVQWTRFGRVMAAYGYPSTKPSRLPAWLGELWSAAEGAKATPKVGWSGPFLEALLQADGCPPASAPAIVLSGLIEGQGYGSRPRQMADPVQYAAAHLDAFRDAIAQGSVEAKLNAVDMIGRNPDLGRAVPDQLRDLAASSSKQVRDKTLNYLSGLPPEWQVYILAAALDQGAPANMAGVVEQLARVSDAGRAHLQAKLATSSGKLADLITTTLQRADLAAVPASDQLVIPPCPPLEVIPLGDEFDAQLAAAIPPWLEKRRQVLANLYALPNPNSWQKDQARRLEAQLAYVSTLSQGQVRQVRDFLNGAIDKRPEGVNQLYEVLSQMRGLGLVPTMRLCANSARNGGTGINWWAVSERCDLDQDVRVLRQAAALVGVTDPEAEATNLAFGWQRYISPENSWPYLAEHPTRLEQALGLRPAPANRYSYSAGGDMARAISILDSFPVLPPAYVPPLAVVAMGTAKTNRAEAQALLQKHGRGVGLATQGLSDGSAEVRASAAAWLGRIGDPAAIPDLQARLAAETREPVQAAILVALRRLGADISAYLSPEALAAAAAKGLKGKPPADAEWLPTLPAVRWADGTPVEPGTIRWWALLAIKLKDPAGAGLIPLYVSLLDEPSQKALGSFVLDAWIAQDTRTATDEEARAYAAVEGPKTYEKYQRWAKGSGGSYYQELAARTPDQVFEEVRRAKLAEYLGSAIGSKGVLALIGGAPGYHVLQAVQRYIRDHGQRRAQVEALITAAATNDDPAAIQLVLQVARRHKQATVQAKAQELVAELADRKGWTPDELADRTIPTAGFEDTGLLTLDYGPRQFTGRITVNPKTAAYGIDLFTPDGKPLKALPTPGASDDAELSKEARAQLTVSKKELKQVVDLQTARLFEAMCTGRTWDAASWQEDLAAHPVMKHLLAGLVWAENPEMLGRRLFRPTVEGELLDATDETVELAPTSRVGLAHVSTMDGEEVAAWRKHLADYQVTPLFEQFDAVAPAYGEGATEITDHRGWLSDSFTIRGRATKRGYSRAPVEDGAWFSQYTKAFTSIGIRVAINFTGSYVPEEQIPAAITELVFEPLAGRSRNLLLSEVPPVLLAESYRDYVVVAQGGTYDPDWQDKAAF